MNYFQLDDLSTMTVKLSFYSLPQQMGQNFKMCTGLETNARPLARGELNSVRASGSSDLTSPVGEWEFYGDLSIIS